MRIQRFLRLLVVLCCIPLVPMVAQAQDPADKLVITKVEAEKYPDVSLKLNYIDAEGNPATDLKDSDFEITIDGGEPISSEITLEKEQQPLSIAFVIDTSPLMDDESTPARKRFRDMIDRLNELVNRLNVDSKMALITFNTEAELKIALTTDGGAVRNEIASMQVATEGAEDAPYPITEAVQLALRELESETATARAVFVYAAGKEGTLDVAQLEESLKDFESNPPSMNFMCFGSDGEGEFRERKANPSSLQAAADAVGGTFLHFFTQDSANIPALVDQVDKRYNSFIALKNNYLVNFRSSLVPPGEHELNIKVRNAEGAVGIEVPKIKPQVSVVVPDTELAGVVELTTKVDASQTPIKKVEYILNNVPIGSSTKGPDFAFEFDAFSPENQQRFPPNKLYKVLVAATDSNDQQSRSEEKSVTLAIAPAPPLLERLKPYALPAGGGLLALLVLIGLIVFLRRRNRPPTIANVNAYDDYGGGGGGGHDATERFVAPTKTSFATERFAPEPATVRPTFSIVVQQGDSEPPRTFALDRRQITIGKDPKNTVSLPNRWVSRNHATLTITQHGAQLTDLDSANGTFLGEYKDRQLTKNMPEDLSVGDVFWVGPEVRVELIEGR